MSRQAGRPALDLSRAGAIILFALAGPCLAAADVAPVPLALGQTLNFDTDDTPAFTPDGNTVFFDRSPASDKKMVMIAHKVAGVWGTPEVAPFSGRWFDQDPVLAPDGSYLLFDSDRPVTPGGQPLTQSLFGRVQPGSNIWRVDRKGAGWSEPVWLGPLINDSAFVDFADIVADGSLYYMRWVDGALHFFRAQYHDGAYLPPVRVEIGDPKITDHDPAVAPDESFMVMDYGKVKGGLGRLCISFNRNGHWTLPQDLGDAVNQDLPWGGKLSLDHRTVYFTGATKIWSLSLDPWLSQPAKP